MKKGKLLKVLLWSVTVCFATTVQSKSVCKKNKTTHAYEITEKNIAECTKLLNKLAKKEEAAEKIPTEIPPVTANPEYPHKSADTQFFASDDPKVIANLTGKPVALVAAPVVKPTLNTAKVTAPVIKPTTNKKASKDKLVSELFASDDPKVIANLTGKSVAAPVSKSMTNKKASKDKLVSELFASDDPKVIANLTGKSVNTSTHAPSNPTHIKPVANVTTSQTVTQSTKPSDNHQDKQTTKKTKHITTKSIAKLPATTVIKPIVIKTVPPATPLPLPPTRPHIELLAPSASDLEPLEEKPTNLKNLNQSPSTVKPLAVEDQKNNKLARKKKQSSSSLPRVDIKKRHP